MYNIKTLNNISSKGLERLSSNLFAVDEEGAQPDGILVRSAAMQDMALPESLLGIARAAQASTISRWTNAARQASWCSTRRAPTPMR